MNKDVKGTISIWLTRFLLLCVTLTIVYGIVTIAVESYYSYRIKHYGVDTVATVIHKYAGYLEYDVHYNGAYYTNFIKVNKRVYRETSVGEHYPARFLPEKMYLHKNNGLSPRYIRIILRPMRTDQQDIETERKRIDSMYSYPALIK